MNISRFVTAAALASAFAMPAHAITHKSGVIESVNPETRTISVSSRTGAITEYHVPSHSKVTVEGKSEGFAALAPNQQITLAYAEPVAEKDAFVKAEIINMNHEEKTAVVKPEGSSETVQVKFSDATKISGKARNLEDLAEGQKIKIKYAAL